ncbi:MAG: tRNA-dihydrouridine synthase, partial [Deltaproteobacteria bacterium]|nr:tRNA-dihydrouridine synthase [Deltaproteobacteria bacterium]
MVDISVDFCGLKLSNPIILASGGPGWDGEHLKRAALAGAGAIIPKSLGPPARWLHHPRVGRMGLVRVGNTPIGMINLELFSTIPLERWIEKELKIAAEGGAPIIASVVANPDPSETQKVASMVAETGYVSMIEINVSCPMPAEKVGMHIGRDPKLTAEQVKAVKEVIDLPVTVKLSPNFAYLDEIAKEAEKAGADAISATNSVQALYGIDIETGKPILPAFGGYSGPAIKPITLRCVAKIARAVRIPVSGIGGISTWRDVVEFIMAGATTVQICTAVMWKGLKIFKELSDGLRAFMERKGYEKITDFRGIALKHLTTVEELAKEPPMHAIVDKSLCNGCGLCANICEYDA